MCQSRGLADANGGLLWEGMRRYRRDEMGRSAGGTDGSTLFDEVTRTDCRGSRHSEALFTFLNRVDSTFFGRVRETLQEWFAHLPESGRPDVRGRIRSGDDHEFMGAFWEIYLHEYLTRSGFSAELHPKIPGTGRTPDFRCRKDSTVIFVEATIIAPPDSEKAANRREAAALDALNRTQVTAFMLWLRILERGTQSLPVARLRPQLERWLASLDADHIAELYQHDPVVSMPEHELSANGWLVLVRAVPKKPEKRGEFTERPVGAWGPAQASLIDTIGPLRANVEDKARAYGALTHPYIVAVLETSSFGNDDIETAEALFGTTQVRFSLVDDSTTHERKPDGVWCGPRGPRNTSVSAVLVARRMTPWGVTKTEPTLWLNPWARHPLSAHLAWRSFVPNAEMGAAASQPAAKPAFEVLGLEADWPGPEDLC